MAYEILTSKEYREKYAGKETQKGSKFNNVIVQEDTALFGLVSFDSKAELRRYHFHEKMVAQGHYQLRRQVPYDIVVNGEHICKYIADFVLDYPDKTFVVEDVKGHETEGYKLKKKLMLACHGIKIVEIRDRKVSSKKQKEIGDRSIKNLLLKQKKESGRKKK